MTAPIAAESAPRRDKDVGATLDVAIGQISVGFEKADNLRAVLKVVASAGRQGAGLVVLPEASMVSPRVPGGVISHAESLDGPFVTAIADAARAQSVAVVAGVFEPAPRERVFNTLVAIDAGGTILGSYRKHLLYDAFGYWESDQVAPGSGAPLFLDIGGFRFGFLTCYELRFPGRALGLVRAGSDALVVPAAWVRGRLKEMQWEILLRARAVEGCVYVIGCGQHGSPYIGASMCVDPEGVVMIAAGEGDDLLLARLRRNRLEAVRQRLSRR